jgi:hypothetical protein
MQYGNRGGSLSFALVSLPATRDDVPGTRNRRQLSSDGRLVQFQGSTVKVLLSSAQGDVRQACPFPRKAADAPDAAVGKSAESQRLSPQQQSPHSAGKQRYFPQRPSSLSQSRRSSARTKCNHIAHPPESRPDCGAYAGVGDRLRS